jgi:hypothetical protein
VLKCIAALSAGLDKKGYIVESHEETSKDGTARTWDDTDDDLRRIGDTNAHMMQQLRVFESYCIEH